MSCPPHSIPLYLVNGVATVWDAQSIIPILSDSILKLTTLPTAAATLHCVHNISGLRAGTLPGVAQQNGFLGLPLTLMQEETAYLVTQGRFKFILALHFCHLFVLTEKKRHRPSRSP